MAFIEVNFFSHVLGKSLSMNAILPRRKRHLYEDTPLKNGEFSYPTLYLLHDLGDDHTIWMRRTSIERYADEHGFAVVMPTTYRGWYTDMYYGPKFRMFIGEELPLICRGFFPGMSERREDTCVAGNGMGGYGALALALTYPQTFGAAATLSAIFDPLCYYPLKDVHDTAFLDAFGPRETFAGSANDLYHLAVSNKEEGCLLPSIYIACAEHDGQIEDNRSMYRHLIDLAYDVCCVERPGKSSWSSWDDEIAQVLSFFDGCRAKER